MVGGNVVRTCSQDRNFDGVAPSCLRVTCKLPEVPANGGVSCTRDSDFNSVCTVYCEVSFFVFGRLKGI